MYIYIYIKLRYISNGLEYVFLFAQGITELFI